MVKVKWTSKIAVQNQKVAALTKAFSFCAGHTIYATTGAWIPCEIGFTE
jgi:hypothetical protein